MLSFRDVRDRLEEIMERVIQDERPVLVTRQGEEAIVMVSLSNWQAMEETSHLMSSPANSARLRRSIVQLELGALT